jgi:hypothetical protein
MKNLNPWIRLGLVVAVFTAALYLAAIFTDPRAALALSFLTNVLAAPFGQKLINWIEGQSIHRNDEGDLRIVKEDNVRNQGSNAVTALLISVTNIYALLYIALAMAVIITSLDNLEAVQMLKFTDLGYIEVQKYLEGILLLIVWLPVITVVSLWLSGSRRVLSFKIFFIGTGLSIPVYLLSAIALGFGTGFGDPDRPSLALGGVLPSIPGYWGFKITALLIQIAMMVLFCLILSTYAWSVARASRFILSLLRRRSHRI